MQDYGHWSVLTETDIKTKVGFVYVITFEDGKKYVGAKKIWKRIKVPPSSFKRGPRKGFEESDWKTYTSSSNEVNFMISKGIMPKEYLIVGWYDSWGKTLMAEMEMQLSNDVLRSDEWLNRQIGGHFNPNCFDELTENDIERYMSADKGNEHVSWPVMYKVGSKTKYVKPEEVVSYLSNGWQFGRSRLEKVCVVGVVSNYQLMDTETGKIVDVTNQNQFARDNQVESGHLTRLLQGDMDSVGKYTLLPEVKRKSVVVEDDSGRMFESLSDCESANGLTRGKASGLCRKGIYKKHIPETRTQYKARLKANPVHQMVRTEVVSKVSNNLRKDVISSLESQFDGKQDMIAWLSDYIEYLKK